MGRRWVKIDGWKSTDGSKLMYGSLKMGGRCMGGKYMVGML